MTGIEYAQESGQKYTQESGQMYAQESGQKYAQESGHKYAPVSGLNSCRLSRALATASDEKPVRRMENVETDQIRRRVRRMKLPVPDYSGL